MKVYCWFASTPNTGDVGSLMSLDRAKRFKRKRCIAALGLFAILMAPNTAKADGTGIFGRWIDAQDGPATGDVGGCDMPGPVCGCEDLSPVCGCEMQGPVCGCETQAPVCGCEEFSPVCGCDGTAGGCDGGPADSLSSRFKLGAGRMGDKIKGLFKRDASPVCDDGCDAATMDSWAASSPDTIQPYAVVRPPVAPVPSTQSFVPAPTPPRTVARQRIDTGVIRESPSTIQTAPPLADPGSGSVALPAAPMQTMPPVQSSVPPTGGIRMPHVNDVPAPPTGTPMDAMGPMDPMGLDRDRFNDPFVDEEAAVRRPRQVQRATYTTRR